MTLLTHKIRTGIKNLTKSSFKFIICLVFISASCQDHNSKSNKNYEETKKTDFENIIDVFNSGEYKKFIELAELELSRSEKKSRFLIPLSIAYCYSRNFEKGLFYSNEMLKIEPENYQALFYKANCLFLLDKIDSAEYYYKKVLVINPHYARANLNLAEVYLKKGDEKNAIKQYLEAIELFHTNNFKKEVILFSKRVLEIDPNNKIPLKYLELYN